MRRSLGVAVLLTVALAQPAGAKPRRTKAPKPPATKQEPTLPEPAPEETPAEVKPSTPRIALPSPQRGDGVAPEIAAALEQGLERALHGLRDTTVVTERELEAMLGAERARQLAGLSVDASVPLPTSLTEAVAVRVARAGAGLELTARRVSPAGTKSATRQAAAETGALVAAADALIAELFPELARATPPATPAPKPETVRRAVRVAVLDARIAGDVPARVAAALNQSFTPEVRKVEGVSAIGSAEIRDMLGLERQRQLLGCAEDNSSCFEELSGALGSEELVSLDLTLVGATWALTARRIDTVRGRVAQTHLAQFEKRDGEELLAVIGPTVAALYPDRPLKPGAVRGVEPEVIRRLNPPPLPRWAFFTTAGVALGAGAAGAVFQALALDARSQHSSLAALSVTQPVPGAQLLALEKDARSRASIATALFLAAGGLALAAAVEAFFVDWRGDRAAFALAPVLSPHGVGVTLSFAPR